MGGEDEERNQSSGIGRRHPRFMRHWMRHAAKVPKGFLRYQLLKKLNEKSMSGSEIMSELENETKGYWKPSPGSIYPLLAWLQDENLIKETEQTEPGTRRYALTERGKEFLDTETKSREQISKHVESLGGIWYGLDPDVGETLRTGREFFRAARDLHRELRRKHSRQELAEARKALEGLTKQIQEITRKLQE